MVRLMLVYVQALNVNVNLGHRNAERFFDGEFYPIHDAVRDFGDAGAVLDHDVKINKDLVVNQFDFNTAPEISTRQNFRNAISQVLVRHADDALAFQHRLRGEAGNGVRRNLNTPQNVFFSHSFAFDCL